MDMLKEEDGWQSSTSITNEDDELREAEFKSELEQSVIKKTEEFEEDEEDSTLNEFDDRWQRDFVGLTYLGRLEARVDIPFHSFTVRTLKTGEKIKVTAMIKDLEDSLGYGRAYRAAVVAAGLMEVDGDTFLVGSKKVESITQKYKYITENWHDFVVDLLYEKINDLEGRVVEIIRDLGLYEDKRQVATVESAVTAGDIEKD